MNLVKLENNELVTTSLIVAEGTEVQHKNVMELINNYKKDFEEFGVVTFQTEKPKGKKGGRPMEYAILSEPQTSFLLTLLRNSETVVEFKKKLVKEFFRMRKLLITIATQKQNLEWQETRQAGKLARREETDTIKDFVEYARSQGSQNADRYYSNITKMENKALFFLAEKYKNIRELMNTQQLMTVKVADTIVIKALKEGMDKKMFYKDIYKLAKERVEGFASIIPQLKIPTEKLQLAM